MLRPSEDTEDETPLLFEVISAYISETEPDKKYVIYTVQVRHVSGRDDAKLATIERRYTDFLNLYNALRKEFPEILSGIVFPKKVLTGNFDNKLITARSSSFEQMLKLVASERRLRDTRALLTFLQETEYFKVKEFIANGDFSYAVSILENQFRLLNNVYTDRSPPVLFSLCRLLGCCVSIPGSPAADKWADLALHRFEGVSDTDLLELYLPLLHVCIKVWWVKGRDKEALEKRFLDLRRQGLKLNDTLSLLDAVDTVEKKKVLTGNFDNKLITARSSSFEQMLKLVASERRLRDTRALLTFLQETEYFKVKEFIANGDFSYAVSILENQFRLLNNVYTDRSPPVLFSLCRLLGCCVSIPGSPAADKWADLALHRFEGVSDTDLLELYLPLLHVCIKVWWVKGRDKEALEKRFLDLRRQGLKLNDTLSLLDAVDTVEKKVYE